MKTYLKTRDYALTGEEFDLVIDEELELLRTLPQPEDLERYYRDEDYISHTDRSKTVQEKIYQQVKKRGFKKKEAWLKKYAGKDLTVLDVGAGTAAFVQYLRSRGWTADGVEPNEKARQVALKKEISLYRSLESLKNKKFDIITLWHVLEHFSDLHKEVDDLLACLKDNGTLFVAVPNFKSLDASVYGKYWAAYDVPRHLWHFSQVSIEKIFNRKGWNVVDTQPMLMDPFYIALLSEGYLKSRMKWLSAFWWGIRSNFYGWRTGEYSSLLYVLKKQGKVF